MKIGIRFHDNDFDQTWMGVLMTLSMAYVWRGVEWKMDKDDLVNIINRISFGCYLAFQHRENKDEHLFSMTKNYFEITEDHIYLDGEVDEYISTDDSCMVLYALDTDIDCIVQNCIYTHGG